MTNPQFTVFSSPTISAYTLLLDKATNKYYPIKRIAKPSSRFSNAKWLRSASPLSKNFDPTIVIENGTGDVMYYAWDNTLRVPSNLSYARRMS